jgi:hypothetical protein
LISYRPSTENLFPLKIIRAPLKGKKKKTDLGYPRDHDGFFMSTISCRYMAPPSPQTRRVIVPFPQTARATPFSFLHDYNLQWMADTPSVPK